MSDFWQPPTSTPSPSCRNRNQKSPDSPGRSEEPIFFSKSAPYNSSTNLAAYSSTKMASIAERDERHASRSADEPEGLRMRRFENRDGSRSPSPQDADTCGTNATADDDLSSSSAQTGSGSGSGILGWLGLGGSVLAATASDSALDATITNDGNIDHKKEDGDRRNLAGKAEHTGAGASKVTTRSLSSSSIGQPKLMREITMEHVIEGVDNTPLSSKLSLSFFRTDTADGLFGPLAGAAGASSSSSSSSSGKSEEEYWRDAGSGKESGGENKFVSFVKELFSSSSSSLLPHENGGARPDSDNNDKNNGGGGRLNYPDDSRPGRTNPNPRKVTFRSQDSTYDDAELSYLVESLGRNNSSIGGTSQRHRSSNFSVSGTIGLDEIPESGSRATPGARGKGGVKGAWRWVKEKVLSPSSSSRSSSGAGGNNSATAATVQRQVLLNSTGDMLSTPPRTGSATTRNGSNGNPASEQKQSAPSSASSSPSSSAKGGGSPTRERLYSTTDYKRNSPPRSSLLLESEREARTMVTMLFGFSTYTSNNSPLDHEGSVNNGMGARGGLAGKRDHDHDELDPRLRELNLAMKSSGVDFAAGPAGSQHWDGDSLVIKRSKEIELKAINSPTNNSSSSHHHHHHPHHDHAIGGGGGGGVLSPARSSMSSRGSSSGVGGSWRMSNSSLSTGNHSHSQHSLPRSNSSYDSLYNIFFRGHHSHVGLDSYRGPSPGGTALSDNHSDSASDWGPMVVPSARSSFASHYTESSVEGRSQGGRSRTRTSSNVSSNSRDSGSLPRGGLPVLWGLLQMIEELMRPLTASLIDYSRKHLTGGDDTVFQEYLRIQPFATGGYMRGMLVCGMGTLFFHIYTLALWPDLSASPCPANKGMFGAVLSAVMGVEATATYVGSMETLLWGWFVLQTALNILQMPSRVVLHLWSWKCSRAMDVDSALSIVRGMVNSDIWVLNRMLGRVLDGCAAFSLVLGETFLWTCAKDDPMRSLVVSLCSTYLLSFMARLGIATAFAISMHDPTILAEARRRGLSKWDFTKLPSFVFTDFKEVNNKDCSICLGTFDLGEMVTMLPCDQKHSFHSPCIRAWLERQNSCPLCMKMV